MISRFLLDDLAMAFADDDPELIEQIFQDLLSHFSYVEGLGLNVYCWSEVWYIQSPSGRTVHDAVYSDGYIDRDLRNLFASKLGRLPFWDELPDSIEASEGVSIQNETFPLVPTVARAAEMYRMNQMCALVTSAALRRSAWEDVIVLPSELASRIYFLSEPESRSKFWRSVALGEKLNAEQISEIAARAFPQLRFADGVWGQTSRLEGSFADLRTLLVNTLGGLNDFALEIWAKFANPYDIQNRMSALAHVDCSPESPNTRRNVKAMRERDVAYDGGVVRCEWHAKLQPHRNRIHFNVTENRILIGLFADHLTI